MKLAPLTDTRQLRANSEYMIGLIDDQIPPPMLGRHVNWEEISLACGVEQISAELRRVGQYDLDAISRCLAQTGRSHKTPSAVRQAAKRRSLVKGLSSKQASDASKPCYRSKPGPEPKPIEEFPEPLFETYDEPVSFQAALQFHIDCFVESYYHLHRAIFRDGDALEATTLLSWLKGTKVHAAWQTWKASIE